MEKKEDKYLKDGVRAEAVARFLDEYFYKYLKRKGKIIERIEEPHLQQLGIDVTWDGKNVDEKAQTDYAGRPLRTFSFEIRNTRSKNIGWAINDKLQTDGYILIWIHKLKDGSTESDKVTFDNIQEIELIGLKKPLIRNYIDEVIGSNNPYDMDSEFYRNILSTYKNENGINRFVQNHRGGTFSYTEFADGHDAYITYSPNKEEKPINLIIRKHVLIEKALFHFYVTTTSITRL